MTDYQDLMLASMASMTCFLLLSLFVYGGKALFLQIYRQPDCYTLYWSGSAVIGIGIFFALIILTHLFLKDFRLSLLASAMTLFSIGFLTKESVDFGASQKVKLWGVGAIFILWALLANMKIGSPQQGITLLNPLATFSEIAHSLRAGNIAIYLDEYNQLPKLSQNYGQSILAAIPALIGIKVPQFALAIWHGISLFLLAGLIYSIYRVWLLGGLRASIVATTIVLLAGTAISLHHIQTIDTESTVLFIRSVDVLLGLCFSVVLLACLVQLQQRDVPPRTSIGVLLALFCLGVSLNAVGAHYILILLSVIAFQLVVQIIRGDYSGTLKAFTYFGVFSLAGALGSWGGGC